MQNRKNILIPIPHYGFDPSEVAIPWKIFSQFGFHIIFATPMGRKASGDKIMLTGEKLGIFKSLLKARKDAVEAYSIMIESESFNSPIKYEEIIVDDFDSVYLPGGHDKGVREYLESEILQKVLPKFFRKRKIVGAICHGPVLLARSIDEESGKSVIYDYKTTSLLKVQELLAYNLTKFRLKDYYLTYPETTVEDEVISVLKNKSQFVQGPIPLFRDTFDKDKHGFFVRDRNYISARWPGDIYSLTLNLIKMLNEQN